MNSSWQKIGFLPSSSEMPEPQDSLCCLLCLSVLYVMSTPFLCKSLLSDHGVSREKAILFFLLNYPWPPFGSRWIQTSQTSILGCWYVFSFSCIWHSTKQKWERLPLIKSFLFFFLSKFPFNCDQEENSNFIPRITENLAGGQQFLSHSTVTAPHSSQPVSQENYKLSVYWSMLEVKSYSSWWALLHEKFGRGQSWLAACAPPPPGSGCSFLHPSPLCCSIQPRLWRLRQRAKDDRIRPCTYKSQSLQKSDCLIIFTSRLWRGKSPTVTNQRESNQSPPGLFVLWHKIIE